MNQNRPITILVFFVGLTLSGCTQDWPGFVEKKHDHSLMEGKISLQGSVRLDFQAYVGPEGCLVEIFSPSGSPISSVEAGPQHLVVADHANKEFWSQPDFPLFSSLKSILEAKSSSQLKLTIKSLPGISRVRLTPRKDKLVLVLKNTSLGKVRLEIFKIEAWQWAAPAPMSIPKGYRELTTTRP